MALPKFRLVFSIWGTCGRALFVETECFGSGRTIDEGILALGLGVGCFSIALIGVLSVVTFSLFDLVSPLNDTG